MVCDNIVQFISLNKFTFQQRFLGRRLLTGALFAENATKCFISSEFSAVVFVFVITFCIVDG